MPTTCPPTDPEADPRVKAVFDDIRATRKTGVVNNLWRHLAFDPGLLAVIAMAGKTNHLATALQVPVDVAFDAMR
jgi:hypothetical protein